LRGSRRAERVAIGLGSNLDDRAATLLHALTGLSRVLSDTRVSGVYESRPVYFLEQPDFLNVCCVGWTQLTPRELLTELQRLERACGRTPGGPRYGPRTLDLDLLLYGGRVIDEPDLVVPHPRLGERAFVLAPLAELAADWEVPTSRHAEVTTVGELARRVGDEGVERTGLHMAPGQREQR